MTLPSNPLSTGTPIVELTTGGPTPYFQRLWLKLLQGVQGDQEGVFTPTIAGDGTAGAHTYSIQVGAYARDGSRVHVQGRAQLSAKDAAMTGNAGIAGLPFTSRNTTSLTAIFAVSYSSIDLGAGYTELKGRLGPNSSFITLAQHGDNIAAALTTAAQISASTAIHFTGTYLV